MFEGLGRKGGRKPKSEAIFIGIGKSNKGKRFILRSASPASRFKIGEIQNRPDYGKVKLVKITAL